MYAYFFGRFALVLRASPSQIVKLPRTNLGNPHIHEVRQRFTPQGMGFVDSGGDHVHLIRYEGYVPASTYCGNPSPRSWGRSAYRHGRALKLPSITHLAEGLLYNHLEAEADARSFTFTWNSN